MLIEAIKVAIIKSCDKAPQSEKGINHKAKLYFHMSETSIDQQLLDKSISEQEWEL